MNWNITLQCCSNLYFLYWNIYILNMIDHTAFILRGNLLSKEELGWDSQLSITVTNTWDAWIYKKKRVILAHGFRDVSFFALGLWQVSTHHGKIMGQKRPPFMSESNEEEARIPVSLLRPSLPWSNFLQ